MKSSSLKSSIVRVIMPLLIALILVAVFWISLRVVLRTEYPLHAVTSTSMEPTLQVGDLLVVQGIPNPCEINADPKVGDIIVFREPTNPSRFIVHRAIRKVNKADHCFFVTKGDNNLSSDPWKVPEDYVIGKVVARVPLVGYLKIYVGNQVGMIIVSLLIIAVLLLDILPLLRKEGKPKQVSRDKTLKFCTFRLGSEPLGTFIRTNNNERLFRVVINAEG